MANIFKKNADRLFPDSPEIYRLKKTFFNVLSFIDEKNWQGACHATTAIMFVLLREQGIEAEACLGEVSKDSIIFDHSWIEVNNEVVDAAVANTLVEGIHFPPVLLGRDLSSGEKSELRYGSDMGSGLDPMARQIAQMPIGEYMQAFPDNQDGLWGIAKQLAKRQNLKFSTPAVKKRWGLANWEIRK